MTNYIVYNEHTGEIAKSVNCPPDIIHLNCGEHQIWIEGAQVDDREWYVVDGQLTQRPSLPLVVEGNVIEGVPEGAIATIEGVDYKADGDAIEFEPSIAGTYQIAVSLFPYQSTTIEVTA